MRTSALAFTLVVLPACFGERLTKVPVPETGVSLRYDLDPGTRCHGHVLVGTTRELPGQGTLDQNLEFDVDLLAIASNTERGGAIVKARVTAVEIDWAQPSVSALVAERFERGAAAHLESVVFEFVASERGRVSEVPGLPTDTEAELATVVQTAIDAIEKTFVPLPEARVRIGESWTEKHTRGRADGPGGRRESELRATFGGLFRLPDDPRELAKLVIDTERRAWLSTDDGPHQGEVDEQTTALFSTTGFLVRLDAEQKRFDPEAGVVFTKTRATWDPPTHVEGSTELEVVTDPCDPNYVGSRPCEE